MSRYLPITLLALLAAAGCVNASDGNSAESADVGANGGDSHTVNGEIHVPAGMKRGAVSTVNGTISVADDATVSAARSVNGEIRVGAHATAEALRSVNGSIVLGAGAHVDETVTSVNGSLTLRDDSQVAGAVGNVNGTIDLTAAHVGGGIQSVNGDINIRGNSHIEGGILMRKPSHGWFNRESSGPRIVIGPGASVAGELRFERKVRLYVSDRATIGRVTGATPIRFSGENPPG